MERIMNFLANLNSFFVANEVAVVAALAAALVLFQLALLASAFMTETAVVPTANNADVDDEAETAVVPHEYEYWATYAYRPWVC